MTLRRADAIAMVAAVLVLAVLQIVVGEGIDINRGLGWDGIGYATWAHDLPGAVEHGLTAYQAQRVLPSALVYLLDRDHPIHGFLLLDGACLVAAAALYTRIAARWSREQAWAGLVAVFASFAVARNALYYPNLTDPTAFLLGMAMAWAYLETRPIVLAGVALAGAFTWPALPPVALLLMLLPRAPMTGALPRRAGLIAAGIATLAGAAVIVHFYVDPLAIDEKWRDLILVGWLPLTGALLAAMVFAGTYAIARHIGRPTRFQPWALAAAVVVYAARWLWIDRVGTAGDGPSGAQFACEQALEALRGPAWGAVHHAAFFGPVVIVGALRWRRLATDPGSALVCLLVLAFAVGTESRQWTHLFPLFAVLAVSTVAWTRRSLLIFAALALAWSKLWWPMATGHAGSSYDWPALRYFMQLGPWASDGTYLAHLLAAVATAIVLWRATSEA